MQWVYDDGGRSQSGFKGKAGDCVTRAVAIASGRPYLEIYEALSRGMKTQRLTKRHSRRKASARNGVSTGRKWFKDYMAELGFRWVPCMTVGAGCKVHLHDGELPPGRLVVSVSGHYTAVIDGVIRDTSDPQRETLTFEPDTGRALRPGESRNHNGIFRVSRRCVYGYFVLET